LLVSAYGEPQATRLGIISLPDKNPEDETAEYWFRMMGSGKYTFGRDVSVLNRNLAFRFGSMSRSYLLAGQLVPDLAFIAAPNSLEASESRRIWWDNYALGRVQSPGTLAKIADFLWAPIAGPDIGINKRIVTIVGGAVLLAVVAGGSGDDDGGGTDERDWRPPEFPDQTPKPAGFRMTIGF
jgi:hypothetical protein